MLVWILTDKLFGISYSKKEVTWWCYKFKHLNVVHCLLGAASYLLIYVNYPLSCKKYLNCLRVRFMIDERYLISKWTRSLHRQRCPTQHWTLRHRQCKLARWVKATPLWLKSHACLVTKKDGFIKGFNFVYFH